MFGSTVESLEVVSHLITRYAIFEDVHMHRNTAATTELEPALTGLYAKILIVLAKAKRYFQTPTAGESHAPKSNHHRLANLSSANGKKWAECF